METKIGVTYRTPCGGGRATYRPDWGDTVRPWIVYTNGTARVHAHSLEAAKRELQARGCRIDDKGAQ